MPVLGIKAILALPLAGVLLDKMGRIKVIMLSLLLLVASSVFLFVAPSPFALWAIVPAMVLAGCGMSGTVAGANTWVTDAAPKEDVGAVLGGLNTMTAISGGGLAFDGDQGGAAVSRWTGFSFATFWGFPWEALPTAVDRETTLHAFVDACSDGASGLFRDGFDNGDLAAWTRVEP